MTRSKNDRVIAASITDGQTHRHTDRQTDRQTDKWTHTQTSKWIKGQTKVWITQVGRQMDVQIDIKTDGQGTSARRDW